MYDKGSGRAYQIHNAAGTEGSEGMLVLLWWKSSHPLDKNTDVLKTRNHSLLALVPYRFIQLRKTNFEILDGNIRISLCYGDRVVRSGGQVVAKCFSGDWLHPEFSSCRQDIAAVEGHKVRELT